MGDPRKHVPQRIFHIDRECYVIFIGTSNRDVRPFLRIGNTPDFPSQAAGEIRDVVITDRLTGNPFYEVHSVEEDTSHELRYLGDPDIVERFQDFVGHEDLQIEAYETYSIEESPPEKHAVVYFYRSGNMSVYYGADKIFALNDREKKDLHFVEEARRVKSEYLRDPLRLQKSAFDGPGVIRVGTSLFYFRDGKLIGNRLTNDYFRTLARAGVDPDQVQAWRIVDPQNEEVVKLFKRARSKRATVTVLASDTTPLKKLAGLFASGTEGGAFRVDVRSSEDGYTQSGDQISDPGKDRLRINPKGFKATIELSPSFSGHEADSSIVAIDGDKPALAVRWNGGDYTLPFASSVPHTFGTEIPQERTLASSYLAVWTPVLRDLIDAPDMALVEQVESYFGRRPQGQAGERALNAIQTRVKALRRPTIPDPLQLFLRNAAALSVLLSRETGGDSTAGLVQLADLIEQTLPQFEDKTVEQAPFVAQVLLGTHGVYPFYRPLSATMSARNIRFSQDVRRQIGSTSRPDRAIFERDRRNLIQLIDELRRRAGRPSVAAAAAGSETVVADEAKTEGAKADGAKGDGAASEKTVAEAAGKEPAAAGKSTADRQPSGSPSRPAAAASSGLTLNPMSGSGRRSDSGGKVKWLALAALLLIALGAGYLLSPWGQDVRDFLVADEPAVEEPEEVPPVDDPPVDDPDVVEAPDPDDVDAIDETPDEPAPDEVEPDELDPDAVDAVPDDPPPDDVDDPVVDPDVDPPVDPIEADDVDIEVDPTGTELSVDVAPFEAVDESLRLDGAFAEIGISIFDIIDVTNAIAVASGYRPMGTTPNLGPDPDWIFPGSALTLPDGEVYRVVATDNMWNLATAFIRDDTADRIAGYLSLLAGVDVEAVSDEEADDLIQELESLRDGAYSSQLAVRFDEAIETIRERRGAPG